jgi:hypothetical protein
MLKPIMKTKIFRLALVIIMEKVKDIDSMEIG